MYILYMLSDIPGTCMCGIAHMHAYADCIHIHIHVHDTHCLWRDRGWLGESVVVFSQVSTWRSCLKGSHCILYTRLNINVCDM